MNKYSFTITYTGDEEFTDKIGNALYEAGCDDASLHASGGSTYATFDREADTLDEAVRSAIRQIESVSGLKVIHVEMDQKQLATITQ